MSDAAVYVFGGIGLTLIGMVLVMIRLLGEIRMIRALIELDFWKRDDSRRTQPEGAGEAKN